MSEAPAGSEQGRDADAAHGEERALAPEPELSARRARPHLALTTGRN